MRSTHTYATMEVSAEAYGDIKKKLLDAQYEHAILKDGKGEEVLDMHGIGLTCGPPDPVIANLRAIAVPPNEEGRLLKNPRRFILDLGEDGFNGFIVHDDAAGVKYADRFTSSSSMSTYVRMMSDIIFNATGVRFSFAIIAQNVATPENPNPAPMPPTTPQ